MGQRKNVYCHKATDNYGRGILVLEVSALYFRHLRLSATVNKMDPSDKAKRAPDDGQQKKKDDNDTELHHVARNLGAAAIGGAESSIQAMGKMDNTTENGDRAVLMLLYDK